MPLQMFTHVPSGIREWGEWGRKQRITADIVAAATVDTAQLIDDAVTNAKLRDSAALSVMGRPVNSVGDPSDIGAATDGHVLRRSGVSLGFGTILAASVSDFNDAAKDAAGATLTDTTSVDLAYSGGPRTISATVLPAGVNHDALLNYVSAQHVSHTGVTLTAGAGLTGGGDISANRTFDVGAGTGITVNANDVAVNVGAAFTWTGIHSFAGGVVGSIISPAQITANQNDYTPTGLLGAFIVRLSSDASRNITGMGRDGNAYIKIVANIGAQNIVFTNEDAASTANQRFTLKGAVSYTLLPGAVVVVFYDGTSDRWRIVLV